MSNRSQLIENLRRIEQHYNEGKVSRDLYEVGTRVRMYVEEGYADYAMRGSWGHKPSAPRWFHTSIAFDPDTERAQIMYRPKEDAPKMRSTTVGKWLSFCVDKMNLDLTAAQVSQYAEWAGQNFKVLRYTYDFNEGGDIVAEYRGNYFGSCMHKNPQVQLYAENPDGVKQIIVKLDEKIIGRALFWITDNGPLIDRVYPSDGGAHVQYIRELADKEGWAYRATDKFAKDTQAGRYYTVRLKDVGTYPYFDTMRYNFVETDADGKKWLWVSTGPNAMKEAQKEGRNVTSSDYDRNSLICPFYGEKFHLDNFTFVPSIPSYVSKRALDELFEKRGDGYRLKENMVRSGMLGRWVSRDESLQLTYGASSGEWVPNDYPWLVDLSGAVGLRKDFKHTRFGWDFPSSVVEATDPPPVSYRGITEGQVVIGTPENGMTQLFRVTSLWANGEPDTVAGTNIRNGRVVTMKLGKAFNLRPATEEEVTAYMDVFINGDLFVLTAPYDGRDRCGQQYEAGALGVVNDFDEAIAHIRGYVGEEGYFHALPVSQLRRVGRIGEVIQGTNITLVAAPDPDRITVNDGGTQSIVNLKGLIEMVTREPAHV